MEIERRVQELETAVAALILRHLGEEGNIEASIAREARLRGFVKHVEALRREGEVVEGKIVDDA